MSSLKIVLWPIFLRIFMVDHPLTKPRARRGMPYPKVPPAKLGRRTADTFFLLPRQYPALELRRDSIEIQYTTIVIP